MSLEVNVQQEKIGVDDVLVLPLEVKTGKEHSLSHNAQLLLYALLMSDHYGTMK